MPVAKAYRLLKAVLNTAADDGLIRRNPCRIRGASVEKSQERPVLTARQVFDLASAIDPRYQALLLLAVFGSLRWGELAALRRADVDLNAQTVRISRQLVELRGGGFGFAPTKSDAGKRVVVIPAAIMPILREHVGRMGKVDDDRLIFTSPEGTPLWHANFRQRVWLPALQAAGLPLIHFHDLRHTGNNQVGRGCGVARADGTDGSFHHPGRAHIPPRQ